LLYNKDEKKLLVNREDEIVAGSLITHDGTIVHPQFGGIPAPAPKPAQPETATPEAEKPAAKKPAAPKPTAAKPTKPAAKTKTTKKADK
jgi:NAD(P) transhydrogenase subunit alpha